MHQIWLRRSSKEHQIVKLWPGLHDQPTFLRLLKSSFDKHLACFSLMLEVHSEIIPVRNLAKTVMSQLNCLAW